MVNKRLAKSILIYAKEWKPRLVRCNVSQTRFAEIMGVQKNTVTNWFKADEEILLRLPMCRFIEIENAIQQIEAQCKKEGK